MLLSQFAFTAILFAFFGYLRSGLLGILVGAIFGILLCPVIFDGTSTLIRKVRHLGKGPGKVVLSKSKELVESLEMFDEVPPKEEGKKIEGIVPGMSRMIG